MFDHCVSVFFANALYYERTDVIAYMRARGWRPADVAPLLAAFRADSSAAMFDAALEGALLIAPVKMEYFTAEGAAYFSARGNLDVVRDTPSEIMYNVLAPDVYALAMNMGMPVQRDTVLGFIIMHDDADMLARYVAEGHWRGHHLIEDERSEMASFNCRRVISVLVRLGLDTVEGWCDFLGKLMPDAHPERLYSLSAGGVRQLLYAVRAAQVAGIAYDAVRVLDTVRVLNTRIYEYASLVPVLADALTRLVLYPTDTRVPVV
jgi:hypothetical protein